MCDRLRSTYTRLTMDGKRDVRVLFQDAGHSCDDTFSLRTCERVGWIHFFDVIKVKPQDRTIQRMRHKVTRLMCVTDILYRYQYRFILRTITFDLRFGKYFDVHTSSSFSFI